VAGVARKWGSGAGFRWGHVGLLGDRAWGLKKKCLRMLRAGTTPAGDAATCNGPIIFFYSRLGTESVRTTPGPGMDQPIFYCLFFF
jgi:hypothetical protein